MLHDFLKSNKSELIARCQSKATRRADPSQAESAPTDTGIPEFMGQLIETFRLEQTPDFLSRLKVGGQKQPSLMLVPSDVGRAGAEHGRHLRSAGVKIEQVVHGYGDLCQALTELAIEKKAPITVDEFHTFNRLLDDAIAGAVAAFAGDEHAKKPQAAVPSLGPASPIEEMHGLITKALHSFSAIKRGDVGLSGTTSMLHEQSLIDLHGLIDRALARERGESGGAGRGETPGIQRN